MSDITHNIRVLIRVIIVQKWFIVRVDFIIPYALRSTMLLCTSHAEITPSIL